MKIIRLFCLLGAIAVLGGCASAHVSDKDMKQERDSKDQVIEHNQIVNDNDCSTTDSAAKANAVATVDPSATSPSELSKLQYEVYAQVYEQLKPDCVKGKQGASATGGGRYNVSAEELARMPLAQQCEYASTPMLMLMANEARNIDHEAATPGSTSEYRREVLLDDCRRYARMIEEDREFILEQQRIKQQAKTKRLIIDRTTCSWWERIVDSPRGPCDSAIGLKVRIKRHGYYSTPGESRRDLWEKAGYDQWGNHRDTGPDLDWWRKY